LFINQQHDDDVVASSRSSLMFPSLPFVFNFLEKNNELQNWLGACYWLQVKITNRTSSYGFGCSTIQ
jgi:hypothetical protein